MEIKSFEENQIEMESPIMRQYFDLKKKHPDALLLFRCGNFYECYKEDAEKASKILGITLTKSFKTKDEQGKPLVMAGFPNYTLDTYLPKLIRAGQRVAICDQLEAPKQTAKRGISELVSPSKGFLDVDGAMRHELSREVLDALYCSLDNFIADCTKKEVEEHKEAFLELKGFIHKRIQEK